MSSAASSPSVHPTWAALPSDLTANILQRLGAEEILQSAQFVCATWWKVCHNPATWRVIKIVNPDRESEDNREKFTTMCRRAVDLSQGQLLDLTIAYFGDDNLLHYIVDRSSNLERLTLVYCSDISDTSLIEALKKLHELEELHLIFTIIFSGDVEEIGHACPMLKSFTFNKPPSDFIRSITIFPELYNKEALAIAKTMPNLYHLGLLANDLDNEGLLGILDGCPQLESLDLRECCNVDLVGPLGERCCKQIKYMKLPSDPIADYEWVGPDNMGDFIKLADSLKCIDSDSESDVGL